MPKKPSSAREVRRQATREGVKAGTIAPVKRDFNAQELLELQEIQRIVAGRTFEANHVKANTALMPRTGFLWWKRGGKEVAAELMAQARLLDDVKRKWVSQKMVACGYPSDTMCNINLATGKITPSAPSS